MSTDLTCEVTVRKAPGPLPLSTFTVEGKVSASGCQSLDEAARSK